VETRYTELATRLQKKHEVHVFTLRQKPYYGRPIPSEEDDEGVLVHRVMDGNDYFVRNGTRDLTKVAKFVYKCLHGLRNWDLDVIVLSEWPLVHVPPVAFLNHSTCIADWHEVWDSLYITYGLTGMGGYALERMVSRMNSLKHVAVSRFTKERLHKILGIKQQVPVVSNGIDLREFDRVPEDREWGKIVFFGRFVPHKNVPLLFEAKQMLEDRGLHIELHIIGDGPLRDMIEQVARDHSRVTVHGPVSRQELIGHLKSAWAVAIPSTREGQGISFIEAMAAGALVVAAKSPHSAVEELVSHGMNGFVVPPSSIRIADCIELVLRDEPLWNRMRKAGHETSRNYDWEESVVVLERTMRSSL